jgi:hypothetical protein
MSASHSIDGLIKWAQREPWVDDFEATFKRQIDPACRRAGVEPDDLAEAIGADWATSLWGWAFEDFASPRRGERLSEASRLEGERRRSGLHKGAAKLAVSLYEVSDVVAGESFDLA